jgi:hypothetical protein
MLGQRPAAHPDQRTYPPRNVERPRVLIETADKALLISDFRFLVDDGFDVATCAGPGHDRLRCPVLRGEECELVEQADVVLHALDRGRQIPVLVQRPKRQGGPPIPVPEGCMPLDMPCSVGGQLRAIQRAVGR